MSLKYRPFAVIGFTALAALLACVKLSNKLFAVALAAGILIAVITLCSRAVREKVVPFYLAGALILSSLLFYVSYEGNLKYARQFIGKEALIEGVITDDPSFNSSSSRYYYILDLDNIDTNEIDVRLRLSLPHPLDAEAYDTVRLNAKVYDIASDSKEIKQYYNSKGIFLGAYAYNSDEFTYELVKQADKNSIEYRIFAINKEIKRRVSERLPNDYGDTVIAMLLGDKENLDDELNEKFREVGIAPVFAVSGLHLSIWVMGLYGLLREFGVKKRINAIIGIVFTVFFMLVTGLSASLCRAGLMMLVLLSADLFYRKSDSLNSLGFAAFILTSLNPFIVADSGFLMSFSATLGIVTLHPIIDKKLLSKIPATYVGKMYKSIMTATSVSICATLGVFPVTVFQIGYLSLLTVISNVLITYIATVCMVAGGLVSLTYKIPFICDICTAVAGGTSKAVIAIVDFLAELRMTTVSVDNIFWKAGTVACLAVLAASLLFFKKKMLIKAVAVGMSAVITVTCVSAYFYYDGLTQVRLLDVGNGISVVAFNGRNTLAITSDADAYNMSSNVTDSLRQISHRPSQLLLIGDKNGAENSAVLDIIRNVEFKRIVTPESNQSLDVVAESSSITESEFTDIELWEGSKIISVSTDEYSLAHCTFENVSFLLLFESKKNAKIPEEYLTADYLVVSGFIPYSVSPPSFKAVFVCGEEKYISSVVEYVSVSGGNPIVVENYENIFINIRKDSYRIYTLEG